MYEDIVRFLTHGLLIQFGFGCWPNYLAGGKLEEHLLCLFLCNNSIKRLSKQEQVNANCGTWWQTTFSAVPDLTQHLCTLQTENNRRVIYGCKQTPKVAANSGRCSPKRNKKQQHVLHNGGGYTSTLCLWQ